MSAITIPSVGGIRPSTLPRALVPNDGQTANNILARTSEFRPLQNDLVVRVDSGIDNPKTLYRTARDANGNFTSDMTVNWRADAKDVNYVKGQVNDQKSERTYYTQQDGSAPPRVFSVAEVAANGNFFAGIDKPLGVPPPTTAYGSVDTNYNFTPEERTAKLVAAGKELVSIIRSNYVVTWAGMAHPGSSRPGYLDYYWDGSDATHYDLNYATVFRAFLVSPTNPRQVVNTFCGIAPAVFDPANPDAGVFDPSLGGFFVKADARYNFPWVSLGSDYYVVPFHAYGRTFDFNLASTLAACRAVKMPNDATQQLFTDDQLTTLLNQFKTDYGPSNPRIKNLIDTMSASASSVLAKVDTGSFASVNAIAEAQNQLKLLSDSFTAEYTKIVGEWEDAIQNFYFSSGRDSEVPRGIARIIEDRFYIMTYVTAWGEESGPSPVSSLVEVDQNDVVRGAPNNPPAGYGITKFRYYRTNTGNAAAAFQFVDEVVFSGASLDPVNANSTNPAHLTYAVDDKKSTELGEVCPSVTWLTPPSNMRGLVGMPNGIMVGFFDNTVCPCENYVPYAYPVEYQMTTEYPIVGIGVFGQTAVILTQGNPYFCTGSDAASLSLQKIETPQACVSASSIASSDGGVIYASPDGLCMASSQGVQLITENHFTHEDWTAMNPSSIIGAIHELTYYFLATIGSTQRCYALHMGTGKLTTLDVTGSAFYTDLLTDRLYVARGRSIVALFAGPGYRTGTWRSKIHVSPKQDGFAWLAIESDFSADITVKWYGDRALVYTATVTSRTPVRLPAGRYLEHEIEVVTTARWNKLTIASSTGELQSI